MTSFLYGAVAFETKVIAELSNASGNMSQILPDILKQCKFDDKNVSFEQQDYLFSLISRENRVTVVVLTSKDVKGNVRFYAVDQIYQKFVMKYPNYASLPPMSKSAEFGPTIQEIFTQLNNPQQQKIAEINRNIQATQEIMTQNLADALVRGERLEIMQEKSQNLQEHASAFQRSAKKVEQKMCWERYRWYIIGGVIIVVVIIIIIIAASAGKKKKE